jgi:hypothetical protein
MAFNQIQFQHGMSVSEVLQCFGTEAQCAEAVKQSRWPDGFLCPRCDGAGHCALDENARRLVQCCWCRHQTSLTAGSLMEHTKLPLTTWFLAVYLITKAKNRLAGTVQLDDPYLGGERAGGKSGRGSENKVPFVAAVLLNEAAHTMPIKLNLVGGFTWTAVGNWAKASLEPGTLVVSDGLGCFAAVADAGCNHLPLVVGALKPRDLPQFKWVNTVLGNLKTTLAGAFHSLKYNKYASHYLAAFAYRFNRRFDLRTLIARLIVDVSRCRPIPEKLVRAQAEAHF